MIVAGIANYYVFFPAVIVVTAYLLVRWYYITTAREIKRLEAIGVYGVSLAFVCACIYIRIVMYVVSGESTHTHTHTRVCVCVCAVYYVPITVCNLILV